MSLIGVLAIGMVTLELCGDALRIVSFDKENQLVFQGATPSNYFTLEYSQFATGPWTNWASLTDQPITGAIMSVQAPLFFRIRQTEASAVLPYSLTGHTHQVTSDMLSEGSVGSQKIAPSAVKNALLAEGAVTEDKIQARGVLVNNLNADMVDGLHADKLMLSLTGLGIKCGLLSGRSDEDVQVTFKSPYPDANYAIILSGETYKESNLTSQVRPTWSDKTPNGFKVLMYAGLIPHRTVRCHWIAVPYTE